MKIKTKPNRTPAEREKFIIKLFVATIIVGFTLELFALGAVIVFFFGK